MTKTISEYEEDFTTQQLKDLSNELWQEQRKIDAVLKVREFKEMK